MERAGQALGTWLSDTFSWSERDREIAAFSLTLILSTGYFLALMIPLSLAFGLLRETLAMTLTAGTIKTFAGGAHLSSGWRCGVVSSGAALGAGWIGYTYGPALAGTLAWATPALILIVGLAVAWVMWRHAPVDVPEKPITSQAQRIRLRRIATAMPVIWCITFAWWLASSTSIQPGSSVHTLWLASTIGLLWETFSVLPLGRRIVRHLDRQIGRLTSSEKGGVAT